MNLLVRKLLKWLAIHFATSYALSRLTQYVKRLIIQSYLGKRKIKKAREQELFDMTKKLIAEFRENGFSEKENKLARRIRFFIEKHQIH